MERELLRAARSAGLIRNRFAPVDQTILHVAAGVAALVFAVALLVGQGGEPDVEAGIGAALAAYVCLTILAYLPRGFRESAAGREAAARQLGYRHWLHAHESFTEEPPAEVTIWGRNTAYGVAFGLNRLADELIDFGVGRWDVVWSGVTGTC